MEIYLIRHTTPKIEKGICYGQSDVPLAKSFTAESKKLLSLLPRGIDVVYSSPSIRCYRLAKHIKAKNLIIDQRLLEMNFGDWELKKWDAINPISLNSWMKDFINMRTPHGENFIDLSERVSNFIDDLPVKNYKKVAVVTHQGTIRAFLARLQNIPLVDTMQIKISYGQFIKTVLNDTKKTTSPIVAG